MNLQPLYDLKDRLQHAAIAGTGLICEDFRLHRAVEGLESLACANPVFGKISQAAKQLLGCTEEDRPWKLLDVLSLVDAVVYTQGVVNIPGELMALEPGVGHYCQIPHSILSPLAAALSGTGSGRTSLIRETWKIHPEYFRDFRVLPLAVQALGDSYAELSELVAEILTSIGPDVIPLLKDGFDPEGKSPMAKRVRLIAKLAGAGENDWYLKILPNAQKEVRIAVIQALGLSQENAETLLALCQTEKGKVREAALHAAARLDHPDIQALWRRELGKKPGLLHLLNGVNAPFAAELAANAARSCFESLLSGSTYSSQDRVRIDTINYCLIGKYSPEIREFWLWAAKNMGRFATITPENAAMGDYTLADLLQSGAIESVLGIQSTEMISLVDEMAAVAPDYFLCCQVLMDLRFMAPFAFYDKYSPMIKATGLFHRESEADKIRRLHIFQAFIPVSWDDDRSSYIITHHIRDALSEATISVCDLTPPLDSRWIELMCSGKTASDGQVLVLNTWSGRIDPQEIIPMLVRPDNEAICSAAGAWMYQRMLDTGNLGSYFYPLMKAGWKNWTGVLAHCAKKKGQASYGLCCTVLKAVPMTNKEKAAELRALFDLVENRKISGQNYFWPREAILKSIAQLEADEHYEF